MFQLTIVLFVFVRAEAAALVINLDSVDELMEELRFEPADTPVFLIQIRDANFQPSSIFDETIDRSTTESGSHNNVFILRLFEATTTATTTITPRRALYNHHSHIPHRHSQKNANLMEVDDLDDLRGQMTEIHQDKSLCVVIITAGDDVALPQIKSLEDRIWLQTALRLIYLSRLSADGGVLRPISPMDIKTSVTTTYIDATTKIPPINPGLENVSEETETHEANNEGHSFKDHFKTIGRAVKKIGSKVKDTAKNSINKIKSKGKKLKTFVWNAIKNTFELAKSGIGKSVEITKDVAKSSIKHIKSGYEKLKKIGHDTSHDFKNIFS